MTSDTSSTAWPPTSGVCTPTVPHKDAVFSVTASIKIEAPADKVLENVLKTSDYPKWNTFCPEVRIHKQNLIRPDLRAEEQPEDYADSSKMRVGTVMDFFVVIGPGSHPEIALHHLKGV